MTLEGKVKKTLALFSGWDAGRHNLSVVEADGLRIKFPYGICEIAGDSFNGPFESEHFFPELGRSLWRSGCVPICNPTNDSSRETMNAWREESKLWRTMRANETVEVLRKSGAARMTSWKEPYNLEWNGFSVSQRRGSCRITRANKAAEEEFAQAVGSMFGDFTNLVDRGFGKMKSPDGNIFFLDGQVWMEQAGKTTQIPGCIISHHAANFPPGFQQAWDEYYEANPGSDPRLEVCPGEAAKAFLRRFENRGPADLARAGDDMVDLTWHGKKDTMRLTMVEDRCRFEVPDQAVYLQDGRWIYEYLNPGTRKQCEIPFSVPEETLLMVKSRNAMILPACIMEQFALNLPVNEFTR